MKTVRGDLKFKMIKVSAKGQITLPSDMQKEIGIKKGDEILLIKKGNRILLEKQENLAKKLEDDLKDIAIFSESSLKKLWLNKEDEIWNQYLK
ncbi:MAG: AbrB/MazE/SpoVT family DNA-binding domain-containing protein [Thaumarchaeota archaeon]|nr:AbrB/MazE/SpoVT family DNA-binding domain-containing protein [Nitrososphaerota archaeon]